MSKATPGSAKEYTQRDRVHVRRWNVFLLLPLFMLVTPWFNRIEPRLFGMPFFYWFQTGLGSARRGLPRRGLLRHPKSRTTA